MPIRINLLAEAQATAELRRKDPVKRGIWVSSFLVSVVILWIVKLQMDVMFEQKNYNNIAASMRNQTAKYSSVTNENARVGDVEGKLSKLDYLSTNRFLWAPVFNALQKSMIDNIQVTKITGSQTYTFENPHDIGSGPTLQHLGKATVEKDTLSVEAKDLKPGDQTYAKYKENLCSFDFFLKHLQRRDGFVLDGTLGPVTVDPVDPNKQFITFTLVAHFPDIRRNE